MVITLFENFVPLEPCAWRQMPPLPSFNPALYVKQYINDTRLNLL